MESNEGRCPHRESASSVKSDSETTETTNTQLCDTDDNAEMKTQSGTANIRHDSENERDSKDSK